MTTTKTDLRIATEIHKQLGGKALMMIGAKGFMATDDSLTFKIMRNEKKVTHIKIELNVMDTYDVTYFNIRGIKIKEINKSEGIYNDMLLTSIRVNTSLNTNL